MRLTTAGESHGKGVFALLEGFPAGLDLDFTEIDGELRRRQSGYGRGTRQKIEQDGAEFLSGVRGGRTLGSPILIAVWNKDYENWKEVVAPEGCDRTLRRVTAVRPGHADYVGMRKFGSDDARDILERASARETAARVAAGGVCRRLLGALGIQVTGYVRAIGKIEDDREYSFGEIAAGRRALLGMMDGEAERRAKEQIDLAAAEGDTLGGVAELRIGGLKSGFGSCMTYGEKLDARLAAAVMGVQSVKGVETGLGFGLARRFGSEAHDALYPDGGKVRRETNRAGGIEGGMSNGEEIVLRAAIKPIPTLRKGLPTVDTETGGAVRAAAERSDVCAVPSCEVVLEGAICAELCAVVCERLGGDTLAELQDRYGRLPQ